MVRAREPNPLLKGPFDVWHDKVSSAKERLWVIEAWQRDKNRVRYLLSGRASIGKNAVSSPA
jgi:hypothetical protein